MTAGNLVRASNRAAVAGGVILVVGIGLFFYSSGESVAVAVIGVVVLLVAGVVGQIGRAMQGRVL